MIVEPEDPNESYWQEIEELWEPIEDLKRMHLKFRCRMRGQIKNGEYTGCPKCKARTGDSLMMWKLQTELDELCGVGDPINQIDPLDVPPAGEE